MWFLSWFWRGVFFLNSNGRPSRSEDSVSSMEEMIFVNLNDLYTHERSYSIRPGTLPAANEIVSITDALERKKS